MKKSDDVFLKKHLCKSFRVFNTIQKTDTISAIDSTQ